MLDLLQALRSVLAHELALNGPFLPLGAPEAHHTVPAVPPGSGHAASAASAPIQDGAAAPAASPPEPTEAMANADLFGNERDLSQDASLPTARRLEALLPEDSPLRDMDSLDQVEAYVRENVLIPLDETRLNPVFGVGNPEADLMVIGEAPGAEEDKQGEPFVGRAGMLLNKILEAAGFKREEVYITNILKSRPPNNRDPLPEEVEAHLPVLHKQIALIQPKIILCVGKTAGNALLERRSALGQLRNKLHDYYGTPLVVTYHPAALLRNEQWKRPTWEDVKLMRTRYDQLVGG